MSGKGFHCVQQQSGAIEGLSLDFSVPESAYLSRINLDHIPGLLLRSHETEIGHNGRE